MSIIKHVIIEKLSNLSFTAMLLYEYQFANYESLFQNSFEVFFASRSTMPIKLLQACKVLMIHKFDN